MGGFLELSILVIVTVLVRVAGTAVFRWLGDRIPVWRGAATG
jgi:hypothetical protein